jgi:hypothetical protein
MADGEDAGGKDAGGQAPRALARVEATIVGHESLARRQPRRFDHGMAAALDLERDRLVDHRPAPVARGGKFGETRRDIEPGQRTRRARDRLGRRHGGLA